MNFKKLVFTLLITIILLLGIYVTLIIEQKNKSHHLYVVCTTNIIADTIKNIAGDTIMLDMLMGPGVDPHLYKPVEQDITKITKADIIFYNGLHLEARITDIFKVMSSEKTTIAVTKDIPKHLLLHSPEYPQYFDPHVWFDPILWCYVIETITNTLQEHNKNYHDFYETNKTKYIEKILHMYTKTKDDILTIPLENRVLITGHDAFEYFSRAYAFKVLGLQGINTASETGTKDIQTLVNFIYTKKIPTIFIETSTPSRNLQAIQQSLEHKGFKVSIGQELYSDALGDADTKQGTYIGMMEYNISSIIDGLTPH